MKKKFTALTIALLMILSLQIGVGAIETSESVNVETATEAIGADKTALPSDIGLTDTDIAAHNEENILRSDEKEGQSECNKAHGEPSTDGNGGEGGIFEIILNNVSEILSILTFVISILLTLFYKKGLMPAVDGALCTVKSFGERAEESLSSAKATVNGISERIDDISGVVKAFESAIGTIEKRMCELEEMNVSGEHTKLLVRTDLEELYEIFTDRNGKEINLDIIEKKLTEIKAKLS